MVADVLVQATDNEDDLSAGDIDVAANIILTILDRYGDGILTPQVGVC